MTISALTPGSHVSLTSTTETTKQTPQKSLGGRVVSAIMDPKNRAIAIGITGVALFALALGYFGLVNGLAHLHLPVVTHLSQALLNDPHGLFNKITFIVGLVGLGTALGGAASYCLSKRKQKQPPQVEAPPAEKPQPTEEEIQKQKEAADNRALKEHQQAFDQKTYDPSSDPGVLAAHQHAEDTANNLDW